MYAESGFGKHMSIHLLEFSPFRLNRAYICSFFCQNSSEILTRSVRTYTCSISCHCSAQKTSEATSSPKLNSPRMGRRVLSGSLRSPLFKGLNTRRRPRHLVEDSGIRRTMRQAIFRDASTFLKINPLKSEKGGARTGQPPPPHAANNPTKRKRL